MNATKTVQAGQTINRIASNGHVMTYRVTGANADGTPRLSQLDAVHATKCPCLRHDAH